MNTERLFLACGIAAVIAATAACSSSSSPADGSGSGGATVDCGTSAQDSGCGVGAGGGSAGAAGDAPFCTGKVPLKLFVRFYDPATDTDTPYGEEWVSIEATRARFRLVAVGTTESSTVTETFAVDDYSGTGVAHSFVKDISPVHPGEYDLCGNTTIQFPHTPGAMPYLASFAGVVVWERLEAKYVSATEETVEGMSCSPWKTGYKCTNQRLCLDLYDGDDAHPGIRTFNVIEVDESGFDDSVFDAPTCPDSKAACEALGDDAVYSSTSLGGGCAVGGMSSSWGFDPTAVLGRYAEAKAKYGLK